MCNFSSSSGFRYSLLTAGFCDLRAIRPYPACAWAAEPRNHGAGIVDCDSRRAVGPTKTIRGVYMTQLNRLERLAVLSALREWSFYV